LRIKRTAFVFVVVLLMLNIFLKSPVVSAAGNFGNDHAGTSNYDVLADDMLVASWTLGGVEQYTDTIRFYGRSVDASPHNGKAIICDSSEMLIAVGDPCTISNSNEWQTLTFSSNVTLEADTVYYLGFISDYLVWVYYDDEIYTSPNVLDTSNSYASPTDPEDGADDQSREFSIYAVTYDDDIPAPSASWHAMPPAQMWFDLPEWLFINSAGFIFPVEWDPAAQFGFDSFFIFLGLIMIPTSTVYLVRGGRNEASHDKLFWGLVIFVVGWGLLIGGILP